MNQLITTILATSVLLLGLGLIHTEYAVEQLQKDNLDHYRTEVILGTTQAHTQDALIQTNKHLISLSNP